ncbi:MAG: rRNA maturation RNase YbeY [Ktedonobacterales bacterium]
METGHGFDERAREIEQGLELAMVYEPPTLVEDTFGLDDQIIRRIVSLTLARAGVVEPVRVSVLITDDEGLRSLNREYRGLDESTDVLSFPWLEAPLAQAAPDELWLPADRETRHRALPSPDEEDQATGGATHSSSNDTQVIADLPEQAGALEFPVLEAGSLNLGDIAISRDAVERQAAHAGYSAAWEFAYLLVHGVLHLVGYDDHTDAGYRVMVAYQEAALADAGLDAK